MKPLGEYLKPALSPEQKRESGAAKVRALFERKLREKKEAGDGAR